MPDKKLKIGFYGLTGCAGCQLSFLFNEDDLFILLDLVDLVAFPFIKGKNSEEPLDFVFIEGLVASNDDLEVLQKLRQRAKKVVALGACAHLGNIPAYRKFLHKDDLKGLTYEKIKRIQDVEASPIDRFVAVDYVIPGCPPNRKEIVRFIRDITLGKEPKPCESPVCFECKMNNNPCLLDSGKMCLGPITRGGCNSVCTNSGFECWGCRGPVDDADLLLGIKMLKGKGFSESEIKKRMRTFSGMKMPQLKSMKVEAKKR